MFPLRDLGKGTSSSAAYMRRVCRTNAVHYRIEVENLGLGRAIDVEARLWLIKGSGLRKRKKVRMDVDGQLELIAPPRRDLPGYARAHNRLIRAPPNADPEYKTKRRYSAAWSS